MKSSGQHLLTPLYLKLTDAMPWPEQEKAFYLLSSTGLYLCRNNRFFRSCVRVDDFPSELAGQKSFLQLSYPRIPRRLMERVIGFFDLIGRRYASEAAVLIAWNCDTNSVEIVVPEQVGLVGISWSGKPFPLEVEYEVPSLPPQLVLLGDIHSHVDGPAYASGMDEADELHRPGLHMVIGRLSEEPPQFHCEATADGVRFKVRDVGLILEGYHRRRTNEVPEEWLAKVTVKPWSSKRRSYYSDNSGGSGATSFSNGGGSLWTARTDDLEARALQPGDKADGTRPSSPSLPSPDAQKADPSTNGSTSLGQPTDHPPAP